jgi:hypothetical protein
VKETLVTGLNGRGDNPKESYGQLMIYVLHALSTTNMATCTGEKEVYRQKVSAIFKANETEQQEEM